MPKDEDWLKEPPQTTNTYYFSQDGGVQDSPKTSYTNIAMHPAATSATTSTKTPCDSSQPVDDHWTLSAAQPNPYETGESSEQTHLYPAFNHSSYSREPSDSYGSQSNYTSLSAIFEPSSPSLENSCPPPSTVTDTVTVTVNAEASAAASAFAEAPQITPTKTVTVTARVCNNLPPNSRAGGDYGLATYGNGLTEGSPYVTSEGEGLPNPTGGEAYPTQGGQGVVEPFPTVDTDGGEAYSAGGGNVLPTGGGQGYPTGGEGFSTGGGGFATGEGGYPTMGGEAYPTNTGEVYASGRGGPAYTTPCDVGNNCKSQIAGSGSYGYGVGFPTASATNDGGNWQATGVQVPPFPTIGESYGQPSVNLPQSAMQSGLCAPCSEPGYNSAPYPAGTTSTGTSGGQSYEAPSYSMPSSNSSSRGQSHNTTAVLSNSFPGYGAPYPTTETKNPKFSCPCGMIVGPPPTSEYMSPFETDGSLPPQDSGYHAGSGGLEYPASHPFSALSTNYPAGSAFPQATDSPSNSSISCDNSETINTTVIQDVSFANPFSLFSPIPLLHSNQKAPLLKRSPFKANKTTSPVLQPL